MCGLNHALGLGHDAVCVCVSVCGVACRTRSLVRVQTRGHIHTLARQPKGRKGRDWLMYERWCAANCLGCGRGGVLLNVGEEEAYFALPHLVHLGLEGERVVDLLLGLALVTSTRPNNMRV